jgi:hypothetical protein
MCHVCNKVWYQVYTCRLLLLMMLLLLLLLLPVPCCCRCCQMFESIWYKCSKLNSDLVNRASTAYDMEVEALQHILAWLGEHSTRVLRYGSVWGGSDVKLQVFNRASNAYF